jgi:hypothetical protein
MDSSQKGLSDQAVIKAAGVPQADRPFVSIAMTETELRALCWALDSYLPGLRFDEARVKLERNRHELVAREEALTVLRDRLQQSLDAHAARMADGLKA